MGRDAGRLESAPQLGRRRRRLAGRRRPRRNGSPRVDGTPPTLVFDLLGARPLEAATTSPAPGARIAHVGQSAAATATLVSGYVRGKSMQILGYTNFAVPLDALAQGYGDVLGHATAGRLRLDAEALPLDRVGRPGSGRPVATTSSSCSSRDRRRRPPTDLEPMAVPVIMPKLGAYTEDPVLAEWLVGEGDEVAPGSVVLRARDGEDERRGRGRERGWVHRLVPAGQEVPIGTTVAWIAETREEYAALATAAGRQRGRRTATRSSATSGTVEARLSRRRPAPGSGGGCAGRRSRLRAVRAGAPLVSPRARALLEGARLHARRRSRDRRLRAGRTHPRPRRHRVASAAREPVSGA